MSCCVSLVSDTKNYIELTSFFGVNDNRGSYTRIMNSIESNYNAYVHSIDPVLALNFTGEKSNNTYMCHALSSLLFGEIESQALNFTGRSSNTSVSIIFSEILNGANFTLNYTNGILTIQLVGNENYTFIFDLNTGLVYDLTNYENFTYKGAISCESNGNCPYLFAYTLVGNLYDAMRYKGDLTYHGPEVKLSDNDKKILAEMGGAFSIAGAAIAVPYAISSVELIMAGAIITSSVALPILLCVSLVVVGFALYYYADEYELKRTIGDVSSSFIQDMVV